MGRALDLDGESNLSLLGYYIALRVGFAFPLAEMNHLPENWVEHYTANRYMLMDPVMRWVYGSSGSIRWSDIGYDDPLDVLGQARAFGLRYGASVCCFDEGAGAQRSFGIFVRQDREFTDDELLRLENHVRRLHLAKEPPSNVTKAELEALAMMKEGMRIKQIAHHIGVTEGAVKQRLKNAKRKLLAQTGAQAVTRATEYGLI